MFRFTIRDVLWLMLVIGMSIGWLRTTHRLASSEGKNKRLQKKFDSVLTVARDVAKLDVKDMGEGIAVTVPRDWPQSIPQFNPPGATPAPTVRLPTPTAEP